MLYSCQEINFQKDNNTYISAVVFLLHFCLKMPIVEAGSHYLKQSVLPPDAPLHMIVSPTMNRWGDGSNGHLQNMVSSVQTALKSDGMNDAWILLNDASNTPDADQKRAQGLSEIQKRSEGNSRIMLITSETRAQVSHIVREQTGIRKGVVRALLTGTGYAEQRAALDIVAGGLVTRDGKAMNMLTLDDDTIIPARKCFIDGFPDGMQSRPNSQVLMPDGNAHIRIDGQNSLKPFFEPLGFTVAELRRRDRQLRATRGLSDTMHGVLDKASRGEIAQFEVTHADEPDMEGSDRARIAAVTATKHGVPDYRTVRIAQSHLEGEFPLEEVPIASYPSGENKNFTFLEASTNVDSAALSRRIDSRTTTWPWWYVSSLDISLANPLRTVTGHYRADNELLPVIMKVMLDKGGEPHMYAGGIETQVYHNRARTGYRPDMYEQATASLVGNIAALEASRRLEFDPVTGEAQMYMVDNNYQAPEDHARSVFDEMRNLATICAAKVTELQSRQGNGGRNINDHDFSLISQNIKRYAETKLAIEGKFADFDFKTFKEHLDVEIRDQLNFFADVLKAMPAVIDIVRKLIQDSKYPIIEFNTR